MDRFARQRYNGFLIPGRTWLFYFDAAARHRHRDVLQPVNLFFLSRAETSSVLGRRFGVRGLRKRRVFVRARSIYQWVLSESSLLGSVCRWE